MAIGFAGTSIADIEEGSIDALEEDITNMSPASNSVAANLDGGVAAVDWSSKTGDYFKGFSSDTSTVYSTVVSGSGYVTGFWASGTDVFVVCDDSRVVEKPDTNDGDNGGWIPLLSRFDSQLEIENSTGGGEDFGVSYVLD